MTCQNKLSEAIFNHVGMNIMLEETFDASNKYFYESFIISNLIFYFNPRMTARVCFKLSLGKIWWNTKKWEWINKCILFLCGFDGGMSGSLDTSTGLEIGLAVTFCDPTMLTRFGVTVFSSSRGKGVNWILTSSFDPQLFFGCTNEAMHSPTSRLNI